MPTLSAVPTGSMVNPCCCACHAFYGDTLDAVLSGIVAAGGGVTACDCIALAGGPGSCAFGKVVIGSIPGAWVLTWDAGTSEWVSAAAGSVDVWCSPDDCGSLAYVETVDLTLHAFCVSGPTDPDHTLRWYLLVNGILTPVSDLFQADTTTMGVPVTDPTGCGGTKSGQNGTITPSLP